MKANRLIWALLFLLTTLTRLEAQEVEADQKLFLEIKAKAEKGDPFNQYSLGVCYAEGVGVTRNVTEAAKWYHKAAAQGHSKAQFNLGACYFNGSGVTEDAREAMKWFSKAAEQGLANAQSMVGAMYDAGEGTAKDSVKAVKWFRKAAEQGNSIGQDELGVCYYKGNGVPKDYEEAVRWFRKAAEQGYAKAEYDLGVCFDKGAGVTKNYTEAVRWYFKAAEKEIMLAQTALGRSYYFGYGVGKNYSEAVKWSRTAAEQGAAQAQVILGFCYSNGEGVTKDYVLAYKWINLGAAQGFEAAPEFLTELEEKMTREQIAEAQRLAREFKPRKTLESGSFAPGKHIVDSSPFASGTGFFITEDGFLISNAHVVESATLIRLVTSAGLISAKVVKVDAANDLALLKAEGRFAPLTIAPSRPVKLGSTVTTVGFPNIGLQGFAPKFARGEIASLSGAGDDSRYFQVSVPVQPGNSGGALVDEHGNVVGVVSAKLDAAVALKSSGALPENVNYAVKSSYLLSFLESVPDVTNKLKEPNTKDVKFADVVEQAKEAAVLVLVY